MLKVFFVGAARFELATFPVWAGRDHLNANKKTFIAEGLFCRGGKIRTCDLPALGGTRSPKC